MTVVILIVAMDRNRAIGVRGRIPWRLPADLRRFRELTMGHPVVMGRKTFQSIGKALPGRENVVVTRQKNFRAAGCAVVRELEEALRRDGDVFVIGGAEIYGQALPRAGRAYVTEVDTAVPDADAFFPELPAAEWTLVGQEAREADAQNPHRCRFLTYARKT